MEKKEVWRTFDLTENHETPHGPGNLPEFWKVQAGLSPGVGPDDGF